jgi:hypothetical protein
MAIFNSCFLLYTIRGGDKQKINNGEKSTKLNARNRLGRTFRTHAGLNF